MANIKLTLQIAKEALRAADMIITKNDGEYRVNFPHGREATAYYTNDLQDAVGTGYDMRKRERATKKNPRRGTPTWGNDVAITTVRLVDKTGYKGGEWFVDPSKSGQNLLARIHTDLSRARAEEPGADWHLETRGTHKGWHRWEEKNPRRRYRRKRKTSRRYGRGRRR